ncbi:MAG: 4-deoxy-4-formamido-L-arabinose-phosphoundecaprenol deformylase [Verrucomicrobiaceae bacterium]|nr:4-deoxy-4-formamido-L-arabinose-phosphoundecaprenol deformylase [Verrucomicrobiaceae bacterium]
MTTLPASTPVGLRIDVDTLRGTRIGVPALLETLEKHSIRASFFMSVGPDNMGRNLWRLLRPTFLKKMLRSNAASLYGWDILLRGTAWPGPIIGNRLANIVRMPHSAGHETGLHAWDHYTWQARIDHFSEADIARHMQRGFDKLADILGAAPMCSAAAGWRCNDAALLAKEKFYFSYNSDCRGTQLFRPVVDGNVLTPQIPVTLPTYDEAVGRDNINADNFNDYLLGLIKPDQLNVYTIHAEVEGIAMREQFDQLLGAARLRGIQFKPLGELIEQPITARGTIKPLEIEGRDGWQAVQQSLRAALHTSSQPLRQR